MKTKREITDIRWWRQEEDACHEHVFANLQKISDQTSLRRQMDLLHACLYDDSEMAGLGPGSYGTLDYEPAQLAFNVIRQSVDTLSAKIAKNQPLPTPVTSGGNWHQKRRAQKFAKAIEGQFELSGVWRSSPTIARDCGLFGTGITYNYRVGRTIYHDRVLPWELRIDRRESMSGRPRNVYLRRWVDRYVLAERYPEHREKILETESPDAEEFDIGYDDTCDLVLVVEAWHLPSKEIEPGDTEHDGWHSICVQNCTLLKEQYSRMTFPFSVLKMQDPVVGWFGTGLAKQLTGLQYTINDTASVVQEAHALSGGYILIESGSNVNTDKLQNGRGQALYYNGTPPQWINPEAVNPDTWRFVRDLVPMAFEMSGVSQLSAQSQKPPGVESAVAMNTFNDFETERFALFAKQYEEYHIDVAWQFFDLMEEIQKEYGDLKVRTSTRDRGQRFLQEFDYRKVRLDRKDFTLQVWSTSLLSKKPSAKIQEIEQFINLGWLSQEDGRMLMDFPDLERTTNLLTSAHRIIEAVLEKMLDAEDVDDDDVYTYPEAAFNLKLCVVKGLQTYLDAKCDGCPDENLQLILQFVDDAKAQLGNDNGAPAPMIDPATGAPLPPGAPHPAGPGAPMGGPPMDPSMIPPNDAAAGLPPPEMGGQLPPDAGIQPGRPMLSRP